ncbi:hypothetical protein ACWTQY_33400, partial [Klebsiella pneumoniae]
NAQFLAVGGQAQASEKDSGQQLENDGHTLRLRLSQVKEKLWIGDLQAANLNFYCAAGPGRNPGWRYKGAASAWQLEVVPDCQARVSLVQGVEV